MKKRAALVMLVFIFLVAVVCLAGCGSSTPDAGTTDAGTSDSTAQETKQTTLEKAKSQGYVTVGFANEAPFAFATPEGKLTGQNVEICRAVLKNLGINEMQGVLTEFGSLIPGLKAGRFDMITAGMYITPERAQEVAFADPEYTIGGGLAVKKGNPLNLHSYSDIAANPNVKISVMGGVSEIDQLKACGVKEDQMVISPDNPAALAALIAGRVDCFTATSPSVKNVVETANNPNIEMVMDFKIAEVNGKRQQGFGSSAFRQEDTDFVEAYNAELKKLKESGKVLEIQKEFGFTEAEFAAPELTAQFAIDNW
ncbi:ectoine/hydroxyectoine ABC transporter substrate-binding protein EhuB [Candidatus Formimonas warabiya]|uniref:Ectoine/hydroxyectoine ABC transporter substrate-binding protein EhuB n=1 Tax=Formimonas warabiya TaxID=1761012 RepID=A0A3G1KX72_FORW1|nr:ectoine/hydroxyectoine ABC transporter substrate-binding protein EhuB [Candidatus Formimonas warabiya]ATW27042.1 ectoine/hydroxyectoine ABC transporter substrate-binding protein EhuB [Candidatus Formimonas warabiya]